MNFIKFRKLTYVISIVLICGSLFSIFYKKGFNYGIDFTGGVLIQVKFNKKVDIGELRTVMNENGMNNVVIQSIGQADENLFIIKTKTITENKAATDNIKDKSAEKEETVADKIETILIKSFGTENVETPFQKNELVGPAIGKDLRDKAYLLIFISLLAILIYISIRFQFKFAIAAIVALIHDVTITLGVFSFSNKEINIPIVAAILTIIGYSLNDTIVVFDRIRENLKTASDKNYSGLINTSISETLTRTVITSITTLMVVFSLFVWGGTVIHDFAFTFIVGILIGTYSSIFVASPVLFEWWMKEKK